MYIYISPSNDVPCLFLLMCQSCAPLVAGVGACIPICKVSQLPLYKLVNFRRSRRMYSYMYVCVYVEYIYI